MFTVVILLAVLFMFGFMSTAHYVDVKRVKGWFFGAASNKSTQKVKLIEKDAELEEVEVEAVIVKSRKDDDEVKRNIFATFDKNGDGYVTREELREAMKGAGMVMRESEIEEMVEKMDGNGDGLIDLGEFCESFEMDGIGGDDEGVLREAFDVFDGNKDGVISVEELGKVLVSLGLKQGFKMEDCVEMIRKVDVDGDGGIDFGEFKKMMRAGGSLLIGSFPSH